MSISLWVLAALVLLTLGYALLRRRARLREERLVVCPETQEFEAVRLSAGIRPSSWFTEESAHRLEECSRWPEDCDCEQECRRQLASSDGACRVQSYLELFYSGRSCVLCGMDVSEWSRWAGQSPGLRTPDGRALSWDEIPLRDLPGHLERDDPLCWNCAVIERVVADHPQRITERPQRQKGRAAQS